MKHDCKTCIHMLNKDVDDDGWCYMFLCKQNPAYPCRKYEKVPEMSFPHERVKH